MKFYIKNNSSDTFSYVSNTVIIPPGTTEIPLINWFDLIHDLNFLSDVHNNNLFLNDGFTDYTYPSSLDYLDQIYRSNKYSKDTDGTDLIRGNTGLKAGTDGYPIGRVSDNIKAAISDGYGNPLQSVSGSLKTVADVSISVGSPQYYLSSNKMFSISTDTVSMVSAGTNNPLVLLKNPSGSAKTVYIVSVACGCSVVNVAAYFNMYSNPTISANGTAASIIQRNTGNATASSCLAYFSSTISSNGTLLNSYQFGQNSDSVVFGEDFSIGILPGNSILITGNPTSNNRNANISLIWIEV